MNIYIWLLLLFLEAYKFEEHAGFAMKGVSSLLNPFLLHFVLQSFLGEDIKLRSLPESAEHDIQRYQIIPRGTD